MGNEFVIKNGFISKGDSEVQGSLTATTYYGDGSNLSGTTPWSQSGTSIYYNDGNVGIGTETPSEILEVVQNTEKFRLNLDFADGPQAALSTTRTDIVSRFAASDGVVSTTMNTVGFDWTGSTVYGDPGDSSIYSNTSANGISIISAPGTGTDDYIRLYAGGNPQTNISDLHIQGSGSTKGYVGIGTETPTSKLEVVGSFNLREFGNISTVTGNTAGWYRIGYTSGGDRGGIRVLISYAGGNWTPTTYVINAFKNWSDSVATLQLEKYGQSNYIHEVRIVEDEIDSTTYHLEVYLPNLTAGHNAKIYFDKNLGYEGSWNLNTGVLSASTSVVNPVARSPFTSASDGYTFENIILNNNINNNFWKLEDGDGFLYFKDSNSDTPLTLQAEDNFVGINNTSPLVELDVSGDTKISGTLNIGTLGTGTSVTNLGVDSTGNVVSGNTNTGIYGGDGTIPLNTIASVNGNLTFQGLDEDTKIILKDGNNGGEVHLFSDGNAGQSALEFYNPGGAILTSKIQNAGGDTRFISNGRDLLFTTSTGATTEGLFIEAGTGNVGVGTTTPSVEFHVKGDSSILRLETTSANNSNFIEFYDPSERKGWIGYPSSTSSTDALFIRNEEHGSKIIISTTDSGGTSRTAIGIDANQNVELPSGNLDISGTLNIGTLGTGTSVTNLGIDGSGNVVSGTTGVSDDNKIFSWFMNVT